MSVTEYRPIPGYDGYRVGSDGTVWSRKRATAAGRLSGFDWKLMPGWKTQHGYISYGLVSPNRPGRYDKKYGHELVLLAFVGPRPNGMQCLHANRDGCDNRVENLRYGTPLENSEDKQRHGTMCRGQSHGRSKLTVLDVQEICNLLDDVPDPEIASLFNVHSVTVKDIRRGNRWSHVTGRKKGSGRSTELGVRRRGCRGELVKGSRYPQKLRSILSEFISNAENRCQSCGLFASRHLSSNSDRALELDHKDPNGGDWIENFQVLCRKCNRLKCEMVSPDVVIGEWVNSSPAVLLERMDRLDVMLSNPGWSVPCQ